MHIDDFVVLVRSLMWFVLSGVIWLGLRDYFELKYKRKTKRWIAIKIALGIIVICNFAILMYAVVHGLGVK